MVQPLHLCLGTALLRCGEAQKQMGEAERKFAQSTFIHYLTPLRSFTEGEYRVMQVINEPLSKEAFSIYYHVCFFILSTETIGISESIGTASLQRRSQSSFRGTVINFSCLT